MAGAVYMIDWGEAVKGVMKAREAVTKQSRDLGLAAGIMRCPVCEKGELTWGAVPTRRGLHTRGQCTTAGCVSWIE